MSPAALALAIGLHVLAAAALWWAAPLRRVDHAETPIMISMAQEPLSIGTTETPAGTPPEGQTTPAPPAPSEAKAPEAPPPPSPEPALPTVPAVAAPSPPPEVTPPAPAPPPPPARTETATSPSVPTETATETALPAPPSEAEMEATWQTDASSWKPQVTPEPQPEMPPRRPAVRPPTAPRVARTPGQRLQDYPPQTSSLGGPSSSSMEAAMADGGARNDYLSRVYRHIDPYRDYPAAARASRQHGRVVTRVTINRDGGLIDLRLDRSSGWPLLDNAEMAAIRRAMPLPPVPAGMRGDPVVLVLPMNY